MAYSMHGEGFAEVLDGIWHEGQFTFLQSDNGPEFISSVVQKWCKNHNVKQIFSRPGNQLATALLNHSTAFLIKNLI